MYRIRGSVYFSNGSVYFSNFQKLIQNKRSVYRVRVSVGPCIFLIPFCKWGFIRVKLLDFRKLHFDIKITVVWFLYKHPVPRLQWPNCKCEKPQKGHKMSNLWFALALGFTIFYCESSERNESFEASTELTIFRKCLSLSLVAHQKGS